jgi:excisionase family DNA binding protein
MKPILFNQDLYTIEELSDHLRVNRSTIYQLLRKRGLPGFRIGSGWRFERTAIEQWKRLQVVELQQSHAHRQTRSHRE